VLFLIERLKDRSPLDFCGTNLNHSVTSAYAEIFRILTAINIDTMYASAISAAQTAIT
jgi:hypothetical protein